MLLSAVYAHGVCWPWTCGCYPSREALRIAYSLALVIRHAPGFDRPRGTAVCVVPPQGLKG